MELDDEELMTKALGDLLNNFGICACCFEGKSFRNESWWCEACEGHDKPCCDDLNVAYMKMHGRVDNLVRVYGSDRPMFWNLLLGFYGIE